MLVHYGMSWTLINLTIKKIIKNNKEINQKNLFQIDESLANFLFLE